MLDQLSNKISLLEEEILAFENLITSLQYENESLATKNDILNNISTHDPDRLLSKIKTVQYVTFSTNQFTIRQPEPMDILVFLTTSERVNFYTPDSRQCNSKPSFSLPEPLDLIIPNDPKEDSKLKYKISLKYQLPERPEMIFPKEESDSPGPDRHFKGKFSRQYSLPDLMDILVPLSHS